MFSVFFYQLESERGNSYPAVTVWFRCYSSHLPSKLRRLLPQCVKYFPIVPDPEQLIGRRYPVRVGILGIPKDGVGQPDQADHIAGCRGGRRGERQRGRR